MSNNYRELTGREKQRIKKLVTSLCANYDKEYGCLPLDCECPMLGICFTNSALCRYFRKSVLPEDTALEAVFTQTPTTHCKQCGGNTEDQHNNKDYRQYVSALRPGIICPPQAESLFQEKASCSRSQNKPSQSHISIQITGRHAQHHPQRASQEYEGAYHGHHSK